MAGLDGHVRGSEVLAQEEDGKAGDGQGQRVDRAVMERTGPGPSAVGARQRSQAEKQQDQIGQFGKSKNSPAFRVQNG